MQNNASKMNNINLINKNNNYNENENNIEYNIRNSKKPISFIDTINNQKTNKLH